MKNFSSRLMKSGNKTLISFERSKCATKFAIEPWQIIFYFRKKYTFVLKNGRVLDSNSVVNFFLILIF